MLTRSLLLAGLMLSLGLGVALPQPYTWETKKELADIPNGNRARGTFCSSYGQHVLAQPATNPVYYLFGNDGILILNHTFVGISSPFSSVAGFDGLTYAVFESGDDIRVYRSSDAGDNWQDVYTFETDQGVTVNHIDAVADANGVHIVWDNEASTKVYYVRLNPPNFYNIRDVTEISGTSGCRPKVVTSSGRAHVSFVRTDVSPARGASRDLNLSDGTWDTSYRTANALTDPLAQQSLARRGDSLHIVMYEQESPLSNEDIRSARRAIGDTWTNQLVEVDNWNGGSEQSNLYRTTTAALDTIYVSYTKAGVGNGILLRSYPASIAWSGPFTVERYDSSPLIFADVSMSSSRTGICTFWNANDGNAVWFRRRVLPISGSITENSFWTGNNYVAETCYIESGITVRAWPDSRTYVLANKKIVVRPGGTLVVEPGAKFYFETGAQLEVQGTLTVQNDGSQPHALFTKRSGTATWGGIVIQNSSSAPTANLNYADITDAGTAVRVGSNANFSMSDCDVYDAAIGLEIVQSGTGIPAKTISNCSFTDITQAGIYVHNFSNVTIVDNSLQAVDPCPPYSIGIGCDGASPKLLGNYLKGFGGGGLYCSNGSSPVLEDGRLGGHNTITETMDVSVVCGDASNAILGLIGPYMGDEGGQNSIMYGGMGEVELKSSDIIAEWNWWGISEDPSFMFLLDENSSIDYSPWLEAPPSEAQRGGFGLPKETSMLFSPMLRLAIGKRTYAEFDTCAIILRSIIGDRTNTLDERRFALYQLMAISQVMQSQELVAYLQSIRATQSDLVDAIKAILPAALFNEGQRGRALAAFDVNITDYPGGMTEKAALYGKFLDRLYTESDSASSSALLLSLESAYPLSIEAATGRVQLGLFIPGTPEVPNYDNLKFAGGKESKVPAQLQLFQNYPNPFNPVTTIRYTLADASFVSLRVYDLLGREVKRLVDEIQSPGSRSAVFDATGLASGIYFYKLQAGAFTAVKRMIVVK